MKLTFTKYQEDGMMETVKKRFGLLGRNISYSFSKGYFAEKFKTEI
jgi:shikimate dehydrogenase